MTEKLTGCVGFLVLLIGGACVTEIIHRNSLTPEQAAKEDARKAAPEDPKAHHEMTICRHVHEMMEASLRAPSTADFPGCAMHRQVEYTGGGHYNFRSYVDAQNGFGATIRTYADGEAQVNDNLTYAITRFDMN